MFPLRSGEKTLLERCLIAESFISRFLGLMFRKSISEQEAILFPSCNSIHTFFMRFPIDVIFVATSGEVKEVITALSPWRLLLPRRGVKHTLEMSAGRASALGISPGMSLQCGELL